MLVQNLIAGLVKLSEDSNERALTKFLAEIGIDIRDVVLDENGFTAAQAAMIRRMASVLRASMFADGYGDSREMTQGIRILVSFAGDSIGSDVARSWIETAKPLEDPHTLEWEERVTLLQAAVAITAADGSINDAERRFLIDFCAKLAFPPGYVERMIRQVMFGDSFTFEEGGDDVLSLARLTLGVDKTATFAIIKAKYRELVLRHHPDVSAAHGIGREQAEEITKRINWAYDVLKRETFASAA